MKFILVGLRVFLPNLAKFEEQRFIMTELDDLSELPMFFLNVNQTLSEL